MSYHMRIVRSTSTPVTMKAHFRGFELECGHTEYRPTSQNLRRGKLLCYACRNEAKEARRILENVRVLPISERAATPGPRKTA